MALSSLDRVRSVGVFRSGCGRSLPVGCSAVQRIGDGDVHGLGVDRPDQFVEAVEPGQQIGLAAQLAVLQEIRGQGRAQFRGLGEESAQDGEELLLVGQALGAERSDQAEDVVDAEVVSEPLIGDRVGDEGVADGADAGEPLLQLVAAGVAEVVALVVPVAAAAWASRPGRG